MKSKIHKHKHEIKEDKFITAAFITSEFVKNNWKKLLGLLAGIIVIIIIILTINTHKKNINKQALRQFDIAMSYYSNNDFEKAENEFKILIENYSSTKENKLAYLYLGKIYLEKDSVDYTQTEQCFKKAASGIKNEVLKQAAMIGMAKCYLGQKNEENYYSYLEKIAKKFPHSFNTPQLLYEIAEYSYKKNDIESAKNCYHQIVERYKTSSVFHRSKTRLDEIQGVE